MEVFRFFAVSFREGFRTTSPVRLQLTYADFIPEEMKKAFDTRNEIDAAGHRLAAMAYSSRVPVRFLVILFGLALIKKEHWFTAFLLGKQNRVQRKDGEVPT